MFVLLLLASLAAAQPGTECSAFRRVWDAYPGDDVPIDQLKSSLGGMINSGWIQNSCAIRGTMAVRALGLEPGEIGNTRWTDGSGRKYLIRVLEFDQFLRTYLGPPSWVGGAGIRTNQLDAEGKPIWAHPAELRGAGIIRYSQCGFGDASGHIDVYDGRGNLKGHGYAERCQRKEVWNLCTPRSNPNWNAFVQYVRGTTGWDPRGRPRLPGAAALPSSPSTPRQTSSQSSGVISVRRAQELLNTIASKTRNSALNAGVADGIMGRNTIRAITEFQRISRLPATGRLDTATSQALETTSRR